MRPSVKHTTSPSPYPSTSPQLFAYGACSVGAALESQDAAYESPNGIERASMLGLPPPLFLRRKSARLSDECASGGARFRALRHHCYHDGGRGTRAMRDCSKGRAVSPFIMHRARLVDHSCIIPVKIKFPSCSPRHKSSGAGPLKLAHALYLIKAQLELFFLP